MTFENNDINYPLEIKTIRSYFNKETSLKKYYELCYILMQIVSGKVKLMHYYKKQ